jgi:DNA polymerase-3 subunit delta'
VVWISDAALLTDAAANALLKTLEEPPENTWFFLACEEPARLLTTLRSRCRLHHLAPPSESYALAWLEREVNLPQEALLTALRLCASAPAAALELLQEPVDGAAAAVSGAGGLWRAVTGWRCCRYSIMNRRRFACTGWHRCWSMRKNDSRGLPW